VPRLSQANYKSIFCVTLREYSNTPTLSSVKQKFRIGDAVAVLRHAPHTPTSKVSRLHGLLPLLAAILYQRILPFPFQVGSLPFTTLLPLIPQFRAPSVFSCNLCTDAFASSTVMAPAASAFHRLYARFHALMRYSNSVHPNHRHPSAPTIFISPNIHFSTRFYPTDLLHHRTS